MDFFIFFLFPISSRSSKRKRLASNAEPAESAPYNAVLGQGNGERKAPLYHCNYCHKDISGKIRIKCVICPDFDLCIECFSVGAEVTPHKSNHLYRVMVSDLYASVILPSLYMCVYVYYVNAYYELTEMK